MPTPIPLTDCPGLIDLMLTGKEHRANFDLKGHRCSVKRVRNHATFEAVSPEFCLSVIFPGWYAGEHGAPAHVIIMGDAQACMQWLPVEHTDKLALIERLPLDSGDKTLCRLAV